MMSARLIAALLGALGVLLLSAVPASAGLVQLPPPFGCYGSSINGVPCGSGGSSGSLALALSPDGRNLYVASTDAAEVYVFNRNPATGHLQPKPAPVGCVTGGTPNSYCTPARFLDGPHGIAIAPNGKTLYVASIRTDAILVFDRNTTTGALTQKPGNAGCIADDNPDCLDAAELDAPRGLALSPDGRNLYVAAHDSNAVTALTVAADGTLTQTPPAGGAYGCVGYAPACDFGPAMEEPTVVTVPPDGRQVLVGTDSHSVVSVNRSTATGAIAAMHTPGSCLDAEGNNGCPISSLLNRVASLTTGPSGTRVYVATAGALLVLDRAANGTLRRHPGSTGCVDADPDTNCANARGIGGIGVAAVAPGGEHVYLAGGQAVTEYRILRDGGIVPRSGTHGCIWSAAYHTTLRPRNCAVGSGSVWPYALAVSPDSRFVYTADGLTPPMDAAPHNLQAFRRDVAQPVCGNAEVTVVAGSRTALKLPCSDVEQSAFTTAIVKRPRIGRLRAIDQSARTVVYVAPRRRSGRTTFTFQSAYRWGRSGVGSITVRVKPRRIRGVKLKLRYEVFRDHTVLRELKVRGVPRGAKVRRTCTYRGRRCRGRRFVGVSLKPGTRIAVRVSQRGLRSVTKTIHVRARRAPKVTTQWSRRATR